MSGDRKTIGLTLEGREVLDQLMDTGFFKEQMDAAKFAMTLAINQGIAPGDAEGASTVWNVGSFDPAGEIRQMILALYPEVETPFKACEYFIDEGLSQIKKVVKKQKTVDLLKIIKSTQPVV